MLRFLARYLLRDEIDTLKASASRMKLYFELWRRSSLLWERYAREMHKKHPDEPTFEAFFGELPYNESKHPENFGPN